MKVIIVTHGPLARAFVESAKLILGDTVDSYVDIIDFYPYDSMETIKEKIRFQIELLDKRENNVIVLTDLKGGTPFNAAVSLLQDYKFYLIAGINLPMLLEILLTSSEELDSKIIQKIIEIARENITVMYPG